MKNRSGFIGGSDLGAVFNLPPYGCRRKLWYEKTGARPDYAQVETAPMRRGTFFEPIIRDYYQQQTGELVEPGPFNLVDPERPYSTGHLDGRILQNGLIRPWEAKCPGERMFIKIKREGMPDEYILQLQKYIHLSGADAGVYAVFHADTVDLLTFNLARDEGLIKEIGRAEVSFWKEVQEHVEPKRLEASDKRCRACGWRTSCQGAALLELGGSIDTEFETDPSLAPLLAEYWTAHEIFEEAEELIEGVKDRLKQAIGERVVVETTGSRIYFRPQIAMRWQTKALERDHPELAEQYKKSSVSRPLRIFSI